uniref:Uncharacterized protein n=1 Tax=Anguilla anguilla TaxID=7936 RepID=A0A0E9PEX8_ANGAN
MTTVVSGVPKLSTYHVCYSFMAIFN